jgi:hypothetical protein
MMITMTGMTRMIFLINHRDYRAMIIWTLSETHHWQSDLCPGNLLPGNLPFELLPGQDD